VLRIASRTSLPGISVKPAGCHRDSRAGRPAAWDGVVGWTGLVAGVPDITMARTASPMRVSLTRPRTPSTSRIDVFVRGWEYTRFDRLPRKETWMRDPEGIFTTVVSRLTGAVEITLTVRVPVRLSVTDPTVPNPTGLPDKSERGLA
jgi:hypothetical protein